MLLFSIFTLIHLRLTIPNLPVFRLGTLNLYVDPTVLSSGNTSISVLKSSSSCVTGQFQSVQIISQQNNNNAFNACVQSPEKVSGEVKRGVLAYTFDLSCLSSTPTLAPTWTLLLMLPAVVVCFV